LYLNPEPLTLGASPYTLAGREFVRLTSVVSGSLFSLVSNFEAAKENVSGPIAIVGVGAQARPLAAQAHPVDLRTSHTLRPTHFTPYTLNATHPTPYTLRPTHFTPYNPHPTSYTVRPTPFATPPASYTLHFTSRSRHPPPN